MTFDYVLLTIGSDKSRNRLVKVDRVPELVKKDDVDVLVSLFSYGEEAVKYFQIHGSLKGYRGRMAINYLPFDIDSETFEVACSRTKTLLADLKAKGITEYTVAFSGKKGQHIIIPAYIFGGFEPSSVLPQQLLSLAKSLTSVEFDKSIYSFLRLFRLYNSIHPKSGLHKIQIEPELLDFPEKILELAKNQRDRFAVPKQEPTKELARLKDRAFELVPDEYIFSGTANKKPKNKLCILKLLEGVDAGERNEVLCRLTAHFKQEGYTPEFAFELILSWNKFNKVQESVEVLKSTFESIWNGGFTYGCFDWLLDSHCSKDCYLYRTKLNKEEVASTSEIPIYSILDAKKEYDKFINEDRRIRLGISEKIDDLIKGIAPQQIGVVLGRPTSGKSTIAMHLGQYFVTHYSGCFLYISLEMSLAMMYERQMQIVLGENSDFIEKNYTTFEENENLKRFLVTEKASISVKQLKKSIEEYQDRTGEKIEFIIIDYLHAMKSDGQDDRSRINQTVQDLTALAKDLDTRLIYLAHVHRTAMTKEDSVFLPVRMGDGKDSSMIENSAFFIFATHLIRDDPDIVMFQLLKNKNGMPFDSGVRLKRQNKSLKFVEEKMIINLEDL